MKIKQKNFRVSTYHWNRREFDPTNKQDLAEYAYFLDRGSWKNGCPFHLEWPYASIPHMIEHKFVKQFIRSQAKTVK